MMQHETHSSSGPYLMALQSKVRKQDARIAELTAEVASITSKKEAQAKMWAADLDTADKLRNEVDSLRDALNDIQARVASGYFVDANHLGDIARNALKDGV